jgi:hypothetical protein
MGEQFTVEHVEYATSQPFAQVIAAFEAATGDISGGRFERELAASKDVEDFERRIHGYEAESGFMRFLTRPRGLVRPLRRTQEVAALHPWQSADRAHDDEARLSRRPERAGARADPRGRRG